MQIQGKDCVMSDDTKLPFAAAVYVPKKTDKSAMGKFADRMKAGGVDVAGLLQESQIKPGETMRTIESVDIRTGRRLPIKNPMKVQGECGLDVSNLVETSAVLREILDNRPELVVLEKFGGQEQLGKGLYDEIMEIIAAQIPLVISVPEPALETWKEMSSDMGAVIGFTVEEMVAWWEGHLGN